MFSFQLPVDTQARVSQYVMSKTSKTSSAAPSKNGNENDTFDASEYEFNISASLMTKILEDSIQDSVTKHCDTCTCTKLQSKPFCYNESYYSVSTQTNLIGEMKNSLCLNCNAEIKSLRSNISIRSDSPHGVKLINDKHLGIGLTGPLYLIPQPAVEPPQDDKEIFVEKKKSNNIVNENENFKPEDQKSDTTLPKDTVPKVGEDIKQVRKNSLNMEPAVHHKLCDRTKTSISSKISSSHSIGQDDLITKEIPTTKETKAKTENVSGDSVSLRKNSHSSMGAMSRTSSIAKSTVSTHKSNTQVGPGPRFCHLRMQAGSKNILLDNAEPDVPPVLYRRQSKCNENSIFKDLNDGMDNFIDLDKNDEEAKEEPKNDNVVVESTLIDVHVDNNNKESDATENINPINPVLLNVSSSPLQPLKTHNFSNSSENNNNKSQSIGSHQNASEVDNLLNDFSAHVTNVQNNNQSQVEDPKKLEVYTPTDTNEVKIFNFDRYEQNKLASQYTRPLRKIDMSQLHTIENTRISKDFPPHGLSKKEKKIDLAAKTSLPAIVNVYPNLTQTHLKVKETASKKVFTNEQSTSSLSSDDSAAMLQKQQLLRVAEWVEQNLEQQNTYNDPLEEEVSFSSRVARCDTKLSRLTETLNELTLNMPHPVSKYAKVFRDGHNNWVHNNVACHTAKADKAAKQSVKVVNNIAKETIFPVGCDDATVTEVNDMSKSRTTTDSTEFNVGRELRNALNAHGDKEITPEDLARMEYNVKKFLLSGPHWVNSDSMGRSRRTSSKTETDV